MILREFFSSLLLIFFCIQLSANEPYFHKSVAQNGDNIFTFLKRYRLEKDNCNFEKFYELNRLNSESFLIRGKSYYLPVLIYKYDGKSIKTTLGLEGWEQALGIKKYNEFLQKKNLRKQSIAKSNILWVPYHEVGCEGGILPEGEVDVPITDNSSSIEKDVKKLAEELKTPEVEKEVEVKQVKIEIKKDESISGYRKFPIFGKKHAYIPQIDNSLRGKVFYVVAGHGGIDCGAFGMYGRDTLYEDEYAYDVSLRLVRHLISRGALAYMIIRDPDDGLRDDSILKGDTDEYCWGNYKIPYRQREKLQQRSNAINKLYDKHLKQGLTDQTMVAIHIDSRSTAHNTDVFLYYYPNSSSGKKLAKTLHQTFKAKYKKYRANGNYHGTISGRDLHMIRETKPNGVFIELGNIKNSHDQLRFIKSTNREALAKWLYEGLANYKP